ncbi:phosphoribosylformylglycinamidine synthase subunit PurQ [Amycolatopsis sp. cmx-11-12]|uniref:phosphoribosylformylglycinamidine synthase subunit PurQ n=1 Tax=Amycolatopsis sp. cmx-11-12 TaxID=2785795 RepID=UPI003917E0A7
MTVTVNVLHFPGTNCQDETMRAFAQVGAAPRLRYIADLMAGDERLDDADILCIPGGFSFGDHLRGGLIAALALRTQLSTQFRSCRARPMIGICNGFQIAVHAGCFGTDVALRTNRQGTFFDEPSAEHVVEDVAGDVWLAGLDGQSLTFPLAHGEGRFECPDPAGGEHWRPALRYAKGAEVDGSAGAIAGITSTDGLTFGLMNHPERATDPAVRLAFFENGVRAAR